MKRTEEEFLIAINELKKLRMTLRSTNTTENIFINRINELISRYQNGERTNKFYKNITHLEAEDR